MSQEKKRKLYELSGKEDERRTSPPCWTIRFALAHKGLDYEDIAWRRVEKETIAFSGQGLVPVLVDGETVVHDSWKIAEYLDKTYPDTPSLTESIQEQAGVKFIYEWLLASVFSALIPLILQGALDVSAEKDKQYFTEKMEKLLQCKFQEATKEPTPEAIKKFQQSLTPMRKVLSQQPFLGGPNPNLADFCAAGVFAWARAVSPVKLLNSEDAVFEWRERMFSKYHSCVFESIGYEHK